MASLRPFSRHTLIILILHSLWLRDVLSHPINQSEPPYVPDPQGRGTFSLVSGCLIALFLSVWTAVHVNIFPKDTSWLKQSLLRTYWAAIALFAPEVVLFTATTQLIEANRIKYGRNEYLEGQGRTAEQIILSDSPSPSEDLDTMATPNVWSLEHGFFAVMGGFEVKLKDEDKWILSGGRTLTPQGIAELAKLKLLPFVDRETVKGRSKVDQLAKALVCLQALWMVIQTIARKASGLPITLLELNTLAHVGCAVSMYGIWWRKPQNANEPIFISLDPSLAATMSFEVRTHFISGSPNEGEPGTEFDDVLPKNESGLKVIGSFERQKVYRQEILKRRRPNGVVMLLPGQSLEGIPLMVKGTPYHLTMEDIRRLQLIANRPVYLNAVHWRINLLVPHASNFLTDGSINGNRDKFGYPLLALVSFLYGCVHATSWKAHFPTYIEKLMWRVAVCVVAGGGIVICGFVWLNLSLPYNSLYKIFHRPLLASVAFFLAVARVFLVVESFISLRSLPLGAYSTVSWANLIPHIG